MDLMNGNNRRMSVSVGDEPKVEKRKSNIPARRNDGVSQCWVQAARFVEIPKSFVMTTITKPTCSEEHFVRGVT